MKRFFLLICVLSFFYVTHADEIRENATFLELGGTVGMLTINYDRSICEFGGVNKFKFRIGFGVYTTLFLPVHFEYLLGKRHNLEIVAGFNNSFNNFLEGEYSTCIGLGYRYQNNHIFVRFIIYNNPWWVKIYEGTYEMYQNAFPQNKYNGPWPGLSLGYAF